MQTPVIADAACASMEGVHDISTAKLGELLR